MTHASVFNGSSEVRLTGQLDGRVLVSLRCPGPARLEATSVLASELRAALDELDPAGSDTRTDEEDWQARAENAEGFLSARTVDLVEAIEERDKARREREHLRASLEEANAALRASREQPVDITGEMVGRLFRAAGEVIPGWGVSMNDCHHLLQVALTEPTRSKRAEAIEAILADKLGGAYVPHTIRALADRIDSEVQP